MSQASTGGPVVVGVDGSQHGLAAANLAADEAARRMLPLEIVHAYQPPASVGAAPDTAPMSVAGAGDAADSGMRERAERMLHNAAARVRATHPDLPVVTRLREGRPAEVLTEASRQATLVVVGHRGAGGFAGLLAGSVAIQVAHHAAAPVIVVRGEPPVTGPVVVGVDGSEGSDRAVEFAVAEAAMHQTSVIARYAWPTGSTWQPVPAQLGKPPPAMPDQVTESLAAVTSQHPTVAVETEVRSGPAHELLVEASKDARLVVVGSRGGGGFRGLLLGSTSQALVHHAHCPVAVVGPAAELD